MCPLFSLCFSLFFDESMNHVMPVAVYLATKFWMYFTWFFYLMPCILWCWHHIGAINTGEHFQAELEILCVHLGVPRGCELCSTLLWSRANHSSHSFFFSFFFFLRHLMSFWTFKNSGSVSFCENYGKQMVTSKLIQIADVNATVQARPELSQNDQTRSEWKWPQFPFLPVFLCPS